MTDINVRLVRLIGLIFCGLVFCTGVLSVWAATTITYFNVVGGDQEITLTWETEYEIDVQGFYVQRSFQNNGNYQRINNDMIEPTGDSHTGASYEFTDTNVTNGTQYWYKIEIVDLEENSEFSDPVSVIPSSPTSGTATISATSTSRPTLTPISGNNNPNQNLTSTPATPPPPGQSGLPSPPGDNQTASIPTESLLGSDLGTSTSVSESSLISTATLIPLPTVTIIFPTPDPNDLAPLPEPLDDTFNPLSREVLSNLWPIGLLILVWLGLGIWFFLLRHHIN